MNHYIYLVLGVSLLHMSCTKSSIEEVLIEKSIYAHGGMEKWKSMQTFEYNKNIVLYKSDGSLEKELKQEHNYSFTPNLSGSIEWSDSLTRKIVYNDGTAYKINGNAKEEPSQSALNSFNSAFYVLNMPWKLKDASAVISYMGLDTILENRIVHTLKVEYPSEDHKDVWEYYLDEKEYFLVANKVYHGSTTSLITNDEYVTYKGLKFNAKRTSYIVDSLGEIFYLRAKYEYLY